MRHKIFSLTVMLFAALNLSLSAQEAPQSGHSGAPGPPKSSLEGLWQLCTFQKSDSGSIELHLAPVLRILSRDGSYQTVVIKTTAGGCVVTGMGKFEKTSDSTYVEKPQGRPGEAQSAKEQTVTFHLQGPQWLVLDFKNAADGTESHEIWMRLRYQPNGEALIEELKKGQAGASESDIKKQIGRPGNRGGRPPRGNRIGRNNRNQGDIMQGSGEEEHSWMEED